MAFWKKQSKQQPVEEKPVASSAPVPNGLADKKEAVSVSHAPDTHHSLSTQLAQSLGKCVAVMMFKDRFQSFNLQQLKTMVLPALANNQFVVAEGRPKGQDITVPVGLVLWAKLSDELDRKFSSDPSIANRLSGQEWCSGENYWIIETIGPPNVVKAMLQQLVEGPLKNKSFKVRAQKSDGTASIQVFDAAA